MSCIAVVDDRAPLRETVVRIITRQVRKQQLDWSVMGADPLGRVEDYLAWLDEFDVRVLVLDERLDEVPNLDGERARYPGHAVADFLRTTRRDLPQFIVTSIKDLDELDDNAANLEAIIEREDFARKAEIYVSRMIRAGSSYIERYDEELRELDRLSAAVVGGEVDAEAIGRLGTLRGAAQDRHAVETLRDMRSWVESAEQLCGKLSKALDEAGRKG